MGCGLGVGLRVGVGVGCCVGVGGSVGVSVGMLTVGVFRMEASPVVGVGVGVVSRVALPQAVQMQSRRAAMIIPYLRLIFIFRDRVKNQFL